MSTMVSAYILYDGNSGAYVGDLGQTIQINCDRLRAYSPRPCYLLRRLMPGDGTQIQSLLTFDIGSPEWSDQNTLRGFAIEVDGQDSMIDIATWEDLVNACNCPNCDTPNGNPVQSVYGGAPPAFDAPSLTTYCITRSDDGTGYDHDVAVTDYTSQYVGNMRLTSNTSAGVSKYEVQAYSQPTPVGTDTISAGSCS